MATPLAQRQAHLVAAVIVARLSESRPCPNTTRRVVRRFAEGLPAPLSDEKVEPVTCTQVTGSWATIITATCPPRPVSAGRFILHPSVPRRT